MIYPTEVAKRDEACRLTTLDRLWVQGRLKMWGRWSYIAQHREGSIFNQLLSGQMVTKKALSHAIAELSAAGISQEEMKVFLEEIVKGRLSSRLAFCSDDEALMIDRIIGQVFADSPGLITLLHQRYDGHGKSKRSLAGELALQHPELSEATRRRRIDCWLNVAEFALYGPFCDEFRIAHAKTKLSA